MARQKIDYGIDLGTTNSEIARMDNGRITIFRHGPRNKEILPSCVHFTKRRQMLVGDMAYNAISKDKENTFIEFKRAMGSDDIYHSTHMDKSYTPEELSAEILKQLKRAVKDEEFSSVVITVPAAFDQVQIEATRRAAELAGFEYFQLLQEPIAASLAFLYDKKNIEGIWLVFDFGGGTFDAALVGMEEGIMKVIDHAGDNYLGGKNMDWLIVDEKIIPHLEENFSIEAIVNDDDRRLDLRWAWKRYAEEAKITLSDRAFYIIEEESVCEDDNGNKIDTAISINRSEFEQLISPLIDGAISICKELLTRNRLPSSDLMTVLMVGGPTYIPLLREKVKNELYKNINVTIDPMTVVAQGAAIFASTKPIPVEKQPRDYSKIQLILGYPDTTAETELAFGIKVDKEKTKGTVPSKVFAVVTRNDKDWTTGKIELEGGAVLVVRLHLIENTTNGFSVELFDETGNRLACEPNSISILQGIKIAQPPLPHDIGISATVIGAEEEELMVPILTKGTYLPIVSKKTFFAPKKLRPGNSSDVLKIVVWEGKGGTKPIRNTYMNEIRISGDMLSSLLPERSEVTVTIRIDESRRVKTSAYLPYLDKTIEKVMDPDYTLSAVSTDELAHQIEDEKTRLDDIQNKIQQVGEFAGPKPTEIEKSLIEIDDLNEKGRGDKDRSREVQKRLNEIAVKIDGIERSINWPQVENELTEELKATEQVVDRFGDDKAKQILSQLKPEIEKAIELKNVKRAKDVKDKLLQLKLNILFQRKEYWVSVLTNINESFDEIQWSDRSKARDLVDKGSSLLASGQFSDEIKNIVFELWGLMPKADQEKTKVPRTDIPIYIPKL